jgi:hypothetical protein
VKVAPTYCTQLAAARPGSLLQTGAAESCRGVLGQTSPRRTQFFVVCRATTPAMLLPLHARAVARYRRSASRLTAAANAGLRRTADPAVAADQDSHSTAAAAYLPGHAVDCGTGMVSLSGVATSREVFKMRLRRDFDAWRTRSSARYTSVLAWAHSHALHIS